MKGEDYATKSAKWCFKRIGLVLLKSLLCLIVYLSVLSFWGWRVVWSWGLILMILSLFPILNSVIIMVLFYTGINQRCAMRTGALVVENFILFILITFILFDGYEWRIFSTFRRLFSLYFNWHLLYRLFRDCGFDSFGLFPHSFIIIFYSVIKLFRQYKIFKFFPDIELYFCNFISKVFRVLKHINLLKMQKS